MVTIEVEKRLPIVTSSCLALVTAMNSDLNTVPLWIGPMYRGCSQENAGLARLLPVRGHLRNADTDGQRACCRPGASYYGVRSGRRSGDLLPGEESAMRAQGRQQSVSGPASPGCQVANLPRVPRVLVRSASCFSILGS